MATTTEEIRILVKSELDKLSKDLKKTNKQLAETAQTQKKLTGVMQSATASWAKFAIAAAAVGVAIKKGLDIAETAAKFNQSTDAMQKQFGVNADKMLSALRKASGGIVSDTDLIQSANRAMALNVTKDVGQMAQMLTFARIRARAMGITTAQAFSDLATGIGRNSPLILDNLGLITKGWAKQAKAAGVAFDQQFILNKVMGMSAEELKRIGPLVLTDAEAFQKARADMENLALEIGQELLPVVKDLFQSILDNQETVEALKEGAIQIAKGFAFIVKWGIKLAPIIVKLNPLWQILKINIEAVQIAAEKIPEILRDIGDAFAGNAGKMLIFSNIVQGNISKVIRNYKDWLAQDELLAEQLKKRRKEESKAAKGEGAKKPIKPLGLPATPELEKTIKEQKSIMSDYYSFIGESEAAQQERLKEQRDNLLENFKNDKAKRLEIEQSYQDQSTQIAINAAAEKATKIISVTESLFGQISGLSNQLLKNEQIAFDNFQNRVSKNLERIHRDQMNNFNEEFRRQSEHINSLQISEEAKANRLKQLDEERADFERKQSEEKEKLEEALEQKSRKIKRKAAEYAKRIALAQAAISTAQAAATTLASVPFPFSVPLVAAVTALGAAQMAAIASQPIPEAFQGAIIPGSSRGTLVRAGERNQEEAIIPLNNQRAMNKLGGLGGITINIQNLYATEDVPQKMAVEIDRALFKLHQSKNSAFGEAVS